ncbi:hypothetical protein L2D14_08310 [Thalassospiraceae bacterium LMO-JJ14]|nr:hypothetical protein L2D14_08310 [Thalassospiraceae bacterium LMO-JJ14]
MKIKTMALAALVSLAVSACATEQKTDMANVLDAKGLQAIFKQGGGTCTWKTGSTEGQDFYYSTDSKSGGEADRNIGADTMQGTWALKGNQLCVNFGSEECSTLEKAGKKKYKANFGGKAYDLGC